MRIDTVAKQLLFCTVRIVNSHTGGETSVGTGFLLDADPADATSILVLVTNKHVIRDAATLTFEFIKTAPDGEPLLGSTHAVTLTSPDKAFAEHPDPDIDVAVMPMAAVFASIPEEMYVKTLPITWMPSPEEALTIDAIEDITFIGYPNGHRDPLNKTPIVRRGISATPITLAFDGKPVFLVDGSVFGGSSGSPVLIFNEGAFRSGAEAMSIGTRIHLVGVVAATLLREDDLPLEVGTTPFTKVSKELNLGVVFTWEAIEGALDEMFRLRGMSRPPRAVTATGETPP